MKPLSQAQRADKYKLYLRAVQAPDHEANFAARAYRSYYSRPALNFREDFCGTAAI